MTVATPEIVEVTTRRVSCVGQGGALGHPRVYYTIGEKGWVECGYCDRRFVLKKGAEDDAH
ncbi:MAG: zinc-finger domain-containing protein [Pseudomonadota bacterium]